MKMIFVEPQNTDDWVNGTCPCDPAQSDADFLSKYSIAYKEADETDYWLNLLHDNGYLTDGQFTSLSNDCTRILKLLTTIIKSVKAKIPKK